MKNLAQKPLIKKLVILVVSIPILLFAFVAFVDWFHKSDWLLENPTAQVVRTRMDDALLNAFLGNRFGFRDYALKGMPGAFTWRPPRIVPDLYLPESWDGETEFNAIFAEVDNWNPESNTIDVYTYLESPGYLTLDVGEGLDPTKLVVPLFDEFGRPHWDIEVETSFVTERMLTNFLSTFDSEDDLLKFLENFASSEDLTSFIAYGFSGFSQDILVKDVAGNYAWDEAFCKTDQLIVGYSKGVDVRSYEDGDMFTPLVVIVNQGGCGGVDFEQVPATEIKPEDLPAVIHDPSNVEEWTYEYRLFRDDISYLESSEGAEQ